MDRTELSQQRTAGTLLVSVKLGDLVLCAETTSGARIPTTENLLRVAKRYKEETDADEVCSASLCKTCGAANFVGAVKCGHCSGLM